MAHSKDPFVLNSAWSKKKGLFRAPLERQPHHIRLEKELQSKLNVSRLANRARDQAEGIWSVESPARRLIAGVIREIEEL